MKVGDLICYNAAGQKKKSLGLVLDIQRERRPWSTLRTGETDVLIQWCLVGDIMPRRSSYKSPATQTAYHQDHPVSGDLCWHQLGDWFEVVK